jgi:hypothetical protein
LLGQRAFSSTRQPQGLVEYTVKTLTESKKNVQINDAKKALLGMLADKRTPKSCTLKFNYIKN